jgi:hypothetical protein
VTGEPETPEQSVEVCNATHPNNEDTYCGRNKGHTGAHGCPTSKGAINWAQSAPAQDQQAEIDRLRTQLRRTSDLVHGLHKAGLICDEEASYLASDSEQSGKSKDLQIEAVDALRLREAVVMAEQWFYDRGYTAMCEILRAALAPRKAN